MVIMMRDLSEIDDEEKMLSTLSPHAAPFHPYFKKEDSQFAIYNEGMPCLVVTTEADLSNLLHGIQDEALDEGFPPDAQEAAELEAVDDFVETMAALSLLEEREERARHEFNHIKKRWEVRRAEGLRGRPRPPMHLVDPKLHKTTTMSVVAVNSIVPYSHYHVQQEKMRLRESALSRRDFTVKKSSVMVQQRRAVIQQPRKQN